MRVDMQVAEDLKEDQKSATVIYEDNQSAIKITENPMDHPQMKHIVTKYHFTREQMKNGVIKLVYCPSGEMKADILMKPLSKVQFESLQSSLGITTELEK